MPPASLPSFAALPPLLDLLGYQLNGLIVVFTALTSIWLAVELVGVVFKRADARRQAATAAAAPAPTATTEAGDAPSPETVAVIAAAVHMALGEQRHVIRGIETVGTDPDWAREGRREIFSSHRVR